MELVVDWEGPFKLSAFLGEAELRERFHRPGAYAWVQELPDGSRRLGYVGRAMGRPTLSQRQLQHYAHMVSGLYTIPKEYRRCGEPWRPDWRVPKSAEVMLSRDRFKELVDEAFLFAAACSVYLWVTPPDVDLKVIERNLIYDLQPTGTDMGRVSAPAIKLEIRHRSPPALIELFEDRAARLSTLEARLSGP